MSQTTICAGDRRHGRFARACILTAIALFTLPGVTAASGGGSNADILIRDCAGDGGSEPSSVCDPVHWVSPDVWVRFNPDGIDQLQCPSANSNVFVYVRMKNIGGSTLNSGTVEVYYGSASSSLNNWPSYWSTAPTGGLIGTYAVSGIASGSTLVVAIPWNGVPSNTPGDHFCLVARFVSAQDPMTTAEGTSISANTRANNNIAWRNLCSISPAKPTKKIVVNNGRTYQVTTKFKFNTDPAVDGIPLPHGLSIKIGLGPVFYPKWAVNKIGLGNGIVDSPQDLSIIVTNTQAEIGGIDMHPGEESTVEIQVIYPTQLPGDDQIVNWNMAQFEDNDMDPIGGVSYEIHTEGNEATKRAMPSPENLDTKLRLSAQPNMGSATMTLGFTLAVDDRVSLAIYDLNGRLVRTLLSESGRSGGRHDIVWDGQSDAGVQAPSGTYFYRLSTRDGVAEQQLKIVR